MTKFYIKSLPWFRNFELHCRQEQGQKFAYAEPVTLRVDDTPDYEIPKEHPPMMSLEPEDCQQLADALWHAGFRPSEGTGSAGSLAATQKHLEDMRALVSYHTSASLPATK